MFGWFVSFATGGVTAWIPDDEVALDPSDPIDLLPTAVTLSSGEQLRPVPLPPETAVRIYDDGTMDVVLDPSDPEVARLVVGPETTETLSGEQLLWVQVPVETYAIRFEDDGRLCIDFPWGEICSPLPERGCPESVCGNGTRLDGLVAPVDGPAAAVTLPSGEQLLFR